MLPHENCGEAIRIHPALTFFVGDLIELAECLPEGLPDTCREDAFAPSLNLRCIGRERMPQADFIRCPEIERLS
jgi:hypothetical protein